MKAVADTLGVARSNLAARASTATPRQRRGRRPQPDIELLAEIEAIIAQMPSYGYLAHELGLVPLTTPIQSPQSNGMAEAFVKTFKRDYAQVNPRPDAPTVLNQLDCWFEHYTPSIPIRRWDTAHRASSVPYWSDARPRTRSAPGVDRIAANRPRTRSGQGRQPRPARWPSASLDASMAVDHP